MDHSFVIPVYGPAPALPALIASLRAQAGAASTILLTTSTPSAELQALAHREQLPLKVNPLRSGIASDWNFALESASTPWVTLAHQDDLFDEDYVRELGGTLQRYPDALIGFSDFTEHTPSGMRAVNLNVRIKRLLCRRAFGTRECLSEPRDKLRLLSLGNPICCPSVMFNRASLREFQFPQGWRTNLDWMAWITLARRRGAFLYVRAPLVSKGIHPQSETTATIADRARAREDRAVFELFWPRPVAAAISSFYKLGYLSNRVRLSAHSGVPLADAEHSAGYQGDSDPLHRR
jgi:Glycosyl transferase family 2